MNPQMRRFLPLILIAVLAFAFLPQLLKGGKGSKSLSEKDRAALTADAVRRIDSAQVKRLAERGRYTSHLAELVQADTRLAQDLTVPLKVELDVSADGKTYLVQVSSDVLGLARARTGPKITASSCRVTKSRSKAKCPEAAKPKAG